MALKNGHDDPKIASLDEARRRAAEKAKAEARAARGLGRRTNRDLIIGGLMIAMAVGMVAYGIAWLIGMTGPAAR